MNKKFIILFISSVIITALIAWYVMTPETFTDFFKLDTYEEADLPYMRTNFYYYYDSLDDNNRHIYLEIYQALMDRQESIKFDNLSQEQAKIIFNFVIYDHPEIFWTDGFNVENNVMFASNKITLLPSYCYSEEEVQYRQGIIKNYANKILSEISSLDEYSKVKYIYDALIDYTEYDGAAMDKNNICSVMINGRSVCQGYAKTFQYLCQLLNMRCTVITGEANNQKHMWNVVMVNGQWYQIDVTWGDNFNNIGQTVDYEIKKLTAKNYSYFLTTTEEIILTHKINNIVDYPYCTARDDNYFIKENLYITADNDISDVIDIIQEHINQGQKAVTLKFDGIITYRDILDELMSNDAVFVLDGLKENTVTYIENNNLLTVTFLFI